MSCPISLPFLGWSGEVCLYRQSDQHWCIKSLGSFVVSAVSMLAHAMHSSSQLPATALPTVALLDMPRWVADGCGIVQDPSVAQVWVTSNDCSWQCLRPGVSAVFFQDVHSSTPALTPGSEIHLMLRADAFCKWTWYCSRPSISAVFLQIVHGFSLAGALLHCCTQALLFRQNWCQCDLQMDLVASRTQHSAVFLQIVHSFSLASALVHCSRQAWLFRQDWCQCVLQMGLVASKTQHFSSLSQRCTQLQPCKCPGTMS